MSLIEGMTWGLVVLALAVGLFVGALLARRALEARTGPLVGDRTCDWPSSAAPPTESGTRDRRPGRRRPDPPPGQGADELTSAVRSLILEVLAERLPAGWPGLVLCPPFHPGRTVWHVHLAPAVALDLTDGRTVPTALPQPSHEWTLSGGRGVTMAEGDPEPAPSGTTAAIRVSGPYLAVSLLPDEASGGRVVVTVAGATEAASELRAAADDAGAVRAALRHAIGLAVGGRTVGTPPVLGYSVSSWRDHERIWLYATR